MSALTPGQLVSSSPMHLHSNSHNYTGCHNTTQNLHNRTPLPHSQWLTTELSLSLNLAQKHPVESTTGFALPGSLPATDPPLRGLHTVRSGSHSSTDWGDVHFVWHSCAVWRHNCAICRWDISKLDLGLHRCLVAACQHIWDLTAAYCGPGLVARFQTIGTALCWGRGCNSC